MLELIIGLLLTVLWGGLVCYLFWGERRVFWAPWNVRITIAGFIVLSLLLKGLSILFARIEANQPMFY